MAFAGDGRQLAVGDEAGGISILDATAGTILLTQPGAVQLSQNGVSLTTLAAINPDKTGATIIAADVSGTVTGWRQQGGALHKVFETRLSGPVKDLAVSPNRKKIAVCLSDWNKGEIPILDATTGQVLQVLDEMVSQACFLSDHQLITTRMRIWTLD